MEKLFFIVWRQANIVDTVCHTLSTLCCERHPDFLKRSMSILFHFVSLNKRPVLFLNKYKKISPFFEKGNDGKGQENTEKVSHKNFDFKGGLCFVDVAPWMSCLLACPAAIQLLAQNLQKGLAFLLEGISLWLNNPQSTTRCHSSRWVGAFLQFVIILRRYSFFSVVFFSWVFLLFFLSAPLAVPRSMGLHLSWLRNPW